MRERKMPHFFQVPILLLAALLAIAGVVVGIWSHTSDRELAPWIDAIPWGLGGAALTLTVADAIKHQHLSLEHCKVIALGIGSVFVDLFIIVAVVVAAGALLLSGC